MKRPVDVAGKYLRDVIDASGEANSPKWDRAAMLASDLLAKVGAAEDHQCLARSFGYSGPTNEAPVHSVAFDVLVRSQAALDAFGAETDIATVTTGVAAAARIVRTTVRADHEGCAVYMTAAQIGSDGLAPKRISVRVPKRAEVES